MTFAIVQGKLGRLNAPEDTDAFAKAIVRAGGVVGPLDDSTRGIVWPRGLGSELAEVLDAHPAIEWVQLPSAGVESFAEAFSHPVVFTSAKGSFAEPVAEHALALALAMLRIFPVRARAKSWGERAGISLYDATVLIVGGGGIAQEMLSLLAPFRTRNIVVRRSSTPVDGADVTTTLADMSDYLPEADLVIVAAASTAETRGMINADFLGKLPRHAVLVNIARGDLVNTDDLVAALRADQILGAGLDVTDPEPLPDSHPLWELDNALVTPHTADTFEMVERMLSDRVENNVRLFLAGQTLTGVVDPELGY